MKISSLLFCLVFVSFICCQSAKAQAIDANDSLALVDFYKSTNGSNWINHTNWLTTKPVSTWYGIIVTDTRVTTINLHYNNVTGTVPSSIGNLTGLTLFSLSFNSVEGAIPASIGKLTNLIYWYWDNNKFTGEIPASIGNMKSLGELILYTNQLTGSIPGSVVKLSNLYFADLSDNQLTLKKNVSFPDFTRVLNYFGLFKNRFTFDGLEFAASKFAFADYAPQAPVSIHLTTAYGLSVYAGGTLSNNTYHWYKVGQAGYRVTKGDSTIRPTESGKYYATVTNSVARQLTLYTDTIDYVVTELNNTAPLAVSIYPNPVKGMLTLNGLDAKNNYTITIADISGQVWVKAAVKNQLAVTYDVSRLKPDSYVLKVENGQAIKTLNFIKE